MMGKRLKSFFVSVCLAFGVFFGVLYAVENEYLTMEKVGNFISHMKDKIMLNNENEEENDETSYVEVPSLPHGECGENAFWVFDNKETLVISGKGEMEDYSVFQLAPWFDIALSIKKVVIEDGITSIGGFSFYCCNIESISISETVEYIGVRAFAFCHSLESITLPDAVVSIGGGAFDYCDSLKNVSMGNKLTELGNYAFHGCSALEEIVIPDSVTYIGAGAFEECTSLHSVKMGKSVSTLDSFLFDNCSSLKEITLPASVRTIEDNIFSNCIALEVINVEKGNKKYHSSNNCLIETESKTLVSGCKTSVIPEDGSVTKIANDAFEGCIELKSLYIPKDVISIPVRLFSNLPLESIIVSKQNPVYHSDNNCLIETESKTLVIGCKNSIIPDDESVVAIGESAFYGCENLKSVVIPNSVKSIGDWAFAYCNSLKEIEIHNAVSQIGESSFRRCESLVSVSLLGEITSLPEKVFDGCTALKNVSLPPHLSSIGYDAFSDCSSLESVIFPETLVHIGSLAFGGCSSLKRIILPEGVTSIDYAAFISCSSLRRIVLPNSLESIGEAAFDRCNSLLSVSVPSSVKYIGDSAFGFIEKDDDEYGVYWKFRLKGYKGSAAEKYAKENGVHFLDIDVFGDSNLPERLSDEYIDEENMLIPNVAEKTLASSLISNLSVFDLTAVIKDENGNVLSDESIVGTGCKVIISGDKEYTVKVRGDVDGTGVVDSSDYLLMKKWALDSVPVSNVYLLAADLYDDEKITLKDTEYFNSIFVNSLSFSEY